jgi:hypothetical protein
MWICGWMDDRYNQRIFLDQLPADLVISWNVNLKTTAGLTHFSRTAAADPSDFLSPMVYSARVELSTKVRMILINSFCARNDIIIPNHIFFNFIF